MEALQIAEKSSEKILIIIGLLTARGMRVGEALTIRVENIDLQNRWLVTGFEEGVKKSPRMTKKVLLFFFPKKV